MEMPEGIEVKNNEIIQIHIGHAGVEIANPCWEFYSLEHGIEADGIIEPGRREDNSFYSCSDIGKITARAIIIDTESSSVDDIRLGPYRRVFKVDHLIAGKNDSANIYARGYYRNSNLLIDQITDVINSLAESCTNLQGFLIFRALGGGTGSGLGGQIMEHLDYCFSKILKYEFVLFPSPVVSPSITEVYNAMLTTHSTMDLSDCTISIDNDSVHEICLNNLDMDRPGYKHLNQIIGQVISSFTSTFRLKGVSNFQFKDINCQLVPYPIVHFPIITYAPIYAPFYAHKPGFDENLSCMKLTNLLFEPKHQLLKYNLVNSKYISAILLYRGNVTVTDINETIEDLKTKSTNFLKINDIKYGLNSMKPTHPIDSRVIGTENDVCLLGNNCAIRQTWIPIVKKFNQLYRKKAFLYHYLSEGLNESEFTEAKISICNLMEEYKDLEDKPVEFSRQCEEQLDEHSNKN